MSVEVCTLVVNVAVVVVIVITLLLSPPPSPVLPRHLNSSIEPTSLRRGEGLMAGLFLFMVVFVRARVGGHGMRRW